MESKEFKNTEYEKMFENMNNISTQLQNFYWYFLGSIAAIGIAYQTVIGKDLDLCPDQKKWFILGGCLIGNIVFWLIGEYAISHGFLFRFIQAKAARIEKEIWGPNHLVKDPSDTKNYIIIDEKDRKPKFYMRHLLPDQFVPIYWASIWLISLNAIIAYYVLHYVILIGERWDFIACALISLPLIWKLWDYYIYKIEKLFGDFKIEISYCCRDKKNENFFDFPGWLIVFVLPAFVGFVLHFVRFVFRPVKLLKKMIALEIKESSEKRICLTKRPKPWERFLFLLNSVT